MERDRQELSGVETTHNFNSHAHVERDILIQYQIVLQKYFNSHAHVERDSPPLFCMNITCISTHTLTWSVTLANENVFCYQGISTHTLTWSVTDTIIYICDFGKISTHTLTWSVTALAKDHSKVLIFQLTRSRGA